jgi:hypothetical protein
MNELQFEHLDVEIKKKIFKHYLDHKAAIEQVLAKQQPQGAPGEGAPGGGGENPLAALMGGAAGAAGGGGAPSPAQGAPTP